MRHLSLISAVLLFATVAAACAQSRSSTAPPQASRRIIDMHLHAYNAWRPQTAADSAFYPVFLSRPATDEALMSESLAALRRYNIVKAVASGSPEVVERWMSAEPNRIIPGHQLGNPRNREERLEWIREEVKAGRLKVLAEVVWQYAGVSPSDSIVEPYLALAEELDLPVGIHMGLGPPGAAHQGSYRSRLSSPLLLEEALVRHPTLRVYVIHAGWPMLDDMVAMLYAFPNLYVDVGVINWYTPRAEFHAYLKRLVEAGFGKRILFGSDQMVWPNAIGLAIEAIESAPFLTEDQKRDIFHDNAVRFLRLGGT